VRRKVKNFGMSAPNGGIDADGELAAVEHRRRLGLALFGVIALAAFAELLDLSRGASFFYDEWSWIQDRRGWRVAAFLVPHNGHLSLIPVLVYHALFETVGLRSYLPYRLVLILAHVATCLMLYLYARRRIGPFLGLLPAGVVLFLGAAYQDLVWPFQIGFIASVGFGLAALVLLDGSAANFGERTVARDGGACLCLGASLASSSIGIAVVVGAGVRIVCRRDWKSWWIAVAPVLAYAGWYAHWGNATTGRTSGRVAMVRYFANAYRASAGAVAGQTVHQRPSLVGVVALLVLLAVLARLTLELRRRAMPTDLLGVLAFATCFWALTAVARTSYHDFGASRYLYPGATGILLVLVETLRGLRLPKLVGLGLVVTTALSVWSGHAILVRGASSLNHSAQLSRADLAALEHSRPAPGYRPNRRLMPVVTAGKYRAAVRDLGSPALAWNRLPSQPAALRNDADRVLREAGNLNASRTNRFSEHSNARIRSSHVRGTASEAAGCLRLRPDRLNATIELSVDLPTSGLLVTAGGAPVQITARRFGPRQGAFPGVPPHQMKRLSGVADGSSAPWTLTFTTAAPMQICEAN